ncbi:MAG: twin-arginine translocation signal domain-containing protein [Bacteroidetes bacterium]|nr:MAG: twin-arginine translocation signal domain-containing protein [Bacteroidota bacterium]
MKPTNKHTENGAPNINRRDFLKVSAVVGGTAALAGFSSCASTQEVTLPEGYYPLNQAENVIYSVCLQCHTGCPIKVKVMNGIAAKIDGNPYAAQTMNPPIPYQTAIKDAAKIDGGICPKGQAGIQSLYDPYRIVKVLKRAGKRGENKWMVIPFDQAINEIIEGGKLFSHVEGEEKREVPGLRAIYKLRDSKLAKEMAADAKLVAKGSLSVQAFKSKYRNHLDSLIDSEHPDFGPVNNQFVFQAGRIEHGRKEFAKRWMYGGFGSTNWYEHTTICEQSHHIAYQKITNQYANGKWTGGKTHMKPDLYNSEFVIFFGTGAFEANFGPPYLSNLVTNNMVSGKLKIAVVDPRLSKTAGKAWKWLPVKPGGDAALAYAMIQWLINEGKYDKTFLANANKAAAHADDESCWTNATHLVRIEEDGPGRLLRASDIGIGGEHQFVVISGGRPVAVSPADDNRPVEGELFYQGELNGFKVKTAFQLLSDYANSHSPQEWASMSGVPLKEIVAVSKEFAKHGKKSVAELYRGAVQHTNGYYNAQAIITLNLLAGNPDWKGGLSKGGGHWHEDGSKNGQPFNLKSALHPNKLTAFGHKITREGSFYEESTLFRENGYPARRPWLPHTNNVYQEIIPSADDAYPYPIKALFLHKGTPVYASPAGDKMIQTLVDLNKVPLFFACDIVIGESSMYADYLFPDTAIWERWGTTHITPACPVLTSKVRQPTVSSLVDKVTVWGESMPISMEAIMLAIAEKLEMPGYGKDGFGPGMHFYRQEDFYLKMVANIAAGDKPGDAVPDAGEAEFETFKKARMHLTHDVYELGRWQQATIDPEGRNWFSKVVYVLNRGGRYENFDAYRNSGSKLPHLLKGQMNFYIEDVAMSRHSYTGKRFWGIAPVEPIMSYNGQVVEDSEYPLSLITFKEIHGGQSRTIPNNYWLANIQPENYLLINAQTAREMNLSDGQTVKLVSATNQAGIWDLKNGEKIPVAGKIKVLQGMRPGVVAVSWHYGHWAYGANDVHIDGELIRGEQKRRRGFCTNAIMRADSAMENVCLEDVIGGSASYYDTRVKLLPVNA